MVDHGWVPQAAIAGVFTVRQAYDEGVTRSQLRTMLARDRWRRLVGDALTRADLVVQPRHLALGAVLTWPDATVALRTAARVYGLPVADDGKVHVIVPSPRAARGILQPHEIAIDVGSTQRLGPGRLTRERRTIIDCLGRLPPEESSSLLAWVASRGKLGADHLERWIAENPRALGNGLRRDALRRLTTGAVSALEQRLHVLLREAGIVGWVANAPLFAEIGVLARADVYFPAIRLVVELDGRASHGAAQFQADRTRQNDLVSAGCTILRYTWHDVTARPAAVIAEIRAVKRRLENKVPGLS